VDKFVAEIQTVFGDIKIALMRELTKKFEEHLIGTPAEILAHFKSHPPKGEFVLIFNPKDKSGL
jgi:16S rRNA (cytidine1402-2'-O)-methyltransferase